MNSQPPLPVMPLDFSQPIEAKGSELSAVIAKARAAGYHAHRMKVLPEVVYRLEFFKTIPSRAAGNVSSLGSPRGVFENR